MLGKPSMWNDTFFRTEFLTIAAGCSKDRETWEEFKTHEIPRIIREARECSRTPELDEAFIMGVASGLEARRVLDLDEEHREQEREAIRQRRREQYHECKCGGDCKCREEE